MQFGFRRLIAGVLYPVKLATQLGAVGVVFATLAPRLFPRVPLLVSMESFIPQLVIAGVALTVLALLFRPRALALLPPLSIAWNLAILWPYLPVGLVPALDFWNGGAGPATGTATGAITGTITETVSPRLKVLSANVWYRNGYYRSAINYLTASDADVIGLIELTPNWLRPLDSLAAKYPYRVECLSRPPCEMMLMSKLPFRRGYAGPIDGRSPDIVWGEVELQGRPVIVALTHLAWPLLPAHSNEDANTAGTLQEPPMIGTAPLMQSQQARNLAQYLAGLGKDLVLMGDFNSVPWSGTQDAFRSATGLDNRGPAVPTWPSWQPEWLRLPIDHIFVGGALLRSGFRHGNYINSDHLPVEAEIGFKAE